MPEGHTLHRYARLHRKAFAGQRVRVDSPQGRFEGAAEIDGRRLETVDAYGKHLFYCFDGGWRLHVHLGLFGRFRRFPASRAPEPSSATRLRLATDRAVVHLSGPIACELIDGDAVDALLARLGPDPLRSDPSGDANAERAWAALQRRRSPVGQALLDQAVVAGVGNVYRAEVLFRAGIHPNRPARELDRAEFDALWADLVALLRAGERSGRIVTVQPGRDGGSGSRDGGSGPEEGAATRAQQRERTRVSVYRRTGQPCPRCGSAIVSWPLGGRSVYACPSCQAEAGR